MKTKIILIIFILLIVFLSQAKGCEYSIRDMGFVDIMSVPYHLYFFVEDKTPEDFISIFTETSYTIFMDSNVKFEVVNVNKQISSSLLEYLHFWNIEKFPAVILVSPEGRSMVLPVSVPGKPFKETLWSSLESVVTSLKRKEILNHIVRAYCIVLLIEGKNKADNNRIYNMIADLRRKIAKTMSQLPKRIDEPPYIVKIKQRMLKQESVLLWSLGLNFNDVNEPCVSIIYGRGRIIGPVFKGKQILRNRLYNILSVIGLSCECGLDRKWILGTLIPLKWGEKIQANVVKFLGFDAESPMVKTEVSNILSLGAYSMNTDSSKSDFDKYTEELIKFNNEPVRTRISPSRYRELVTPANVASKSYLNVKITLIVIGIMILFVITAGLYILFRSRRRTL